VLYRVSDVEIDSDQFLVVRGNTPLAIEPQVVDLILFLISQRHRMVSQAEILRMVWSNRAVVVSVIKRAISLARRAFAPQSIIRTVHGRGYQWIAPIYPVARPPDIDLAQDRRFLAG
jgi:DNA-binding winged helix-turn-helix (wHTH) protein